jgi:hypothetical protein
MTTTKQPLTPTASPSRGRHRASSDGETDAAHLPPDRLVVQSCHSTWIFDPQHLRFRRILKGIEVEHRSVATEWRPYWQVQLDVEGDGFTVFLNSSRSRLIRSWRHTRDCSQCGASDTAELSLEDIHLTLHGYPG